MPPASGLACDTYMKRSQEGSPSKTAFALAFKQCHKLTVGSFFAPNCVEKKEWYFKMQWLDWRQERVVLLPG